MESAKAVASDGADCVLVVDDDEVIRRTTRRTLERRGCQVHEAGSGGEALEVVARVSPSVVILDLRMPGMDGHTFLRRFESQHPQGAVVVSSGVGTMDDVIEALRHGAVDFIKKPWTPAELVAAVARASEIAEERRRERVAIAEGRAAHPGGASAAPARDGASFQQVIESIQQGSLNIPAVPAVLSELRTILRGSDAKLAHVTELVARDQWLSAEVLRLAQSSLHRGLRNTVDLRAAVTRIGLRELVALVETAFAHQFFAVENRPLAATVKSLWRFSLARAVLMRSLAPSVMAHRIEPDRAYLAGLFADVGASFLVKVIGEVNKGKGQEPALDGIVAFVRAHHEQAGGAVLKGWGIEPAFMEIARCHHRAQGPVDPLTSLAFLCAHFASAERFAVDLTAEAPVSEAAAAQAKRDLILTDAAIDDAVGTSRDVVDELLSLMG